MGVHCKVISHGVKPSGLASISALKVGFKSNFAGTYFKLICLAPRLALLCINNQDIPKYPYK